MKPLYGPPAETPGMRPPEGSDGGVEAGGFTQLKLGAQFGVGVAPKLQPGIEVGPTVGVPVGVTVAVTVGVGVAVPPREKVTEAVLGLGMPGPGAGVLTEVDSVGVPLTPL